MSQSYKLIILSTIYTVLAMVLVSLDVTYNITSSLIGGDEDYGKGMSLKNKGFFLHIFIFCLLIAIPMLVCKSSEG